jgi:molecular chaperone HscB
LNEGANHFELMGLPVAFAIDPAALERGYRELQSRVHPDRFATASASERRLAAQWAAQANEALRTLRHPVSRARYLLALRGFDTLEESNTAMPADFLMQQMQWRETASDARAARDAAGLAKLRAEIATDSAAMLQQLARALDQDANFEAGCSLVRKLRFLEKLDEELDDALADLPEAHS